MILVLIIATAVVAAHDKNGCQKYLQNLQIFRKLRDGSFSEQKSKSFSKFSLGIPGVQSFEDSPIYFGLKLEIQKQLNETCLDLKLWKYSNSSFNDAVEKLKAEGQTNNLWIYLFNEYNNTQEGYYAFTYQQESQKQIFYFKFKIMINSINKELMLIYEDNPMRLLESTALSTNIESQLNFCTGQTCISTNNSLKIYLNDLIYLQQIITDPNYTNYYLTNTTVYYNIGDTIYPSEDIETFDNSEKGKVKIVLRASLAWSAIAIKVFSSLSTNPKNQMAYYTTQSTINTAFLSLSYFEGLSSLSYGTKLKICKDPLCKNNLDLNDIHFNDEIFIQQILESPYSKTYYLTNSTLLYEGNGLNKIVTPEYISKAKKGKVTIKLKIGIAWQNFTIKMTSYLSKDAICYQDDCSLNEMTVNSEQIECIKARPDSIGCPTCEEMCELNDGINVGICGTCSAINMNILKNLIIILLMLFQ